MLQLTCRFITATTSLGVIHPSIHIAAPLGGSPFTPLCSFTSPQTLRGGAASSCFLFLLFGQSHFLCPSSPHPKHFTSFLITSCLLTSLIPHCITLLVRVSNLFVDFFFSSTLPLLFLQFLARWPNCLHSQHFLPSLPSNSNFILASVHRVLSILLRMLLYSSKDICMLCLEGRIVVREKCIGSLPVD